MKVPKVFICGLIVLQAVIVLAAPPRNVAIMEEAEKPGTVLFM